MQMYPDVDKDFLRGALGKDPSIDDVKNLAEGMAQGNYPKSKDADDDTASVGTTSTFATSPPVSKDKKKRSGLRSKLGKAFGGLRGSNFGGATAPPMRPPPFASPPTASGGGGTGAFGPQSSVHRQEQTGPASPAADASSQASLESMLQQHVAQSARVNENSIHSPETLLTSVPAELDRGETCEVIDGQSLKAFTAYRNGVTAGGVRIFASQRDPSSWDFLEQNTAAIEVFGAVLTQLAHVYE